MNRPALMLASVAALLSLGVAGVAAYTYIEEPHIVVVPEAVVTPAPSEEVSVRPYGEVTLKIGEVAVFKDVSIRPLEVVEDSRCPADVQCIQAGTVRIRLQTVSGMGTSTDVIQLGKSITTEAEEVSFTKASPNTVAGKPIAEGEYQLTFKVTKRAAVVAPLPCYVGGCSSQICSDKPGMASTCEWRESYACYKTARCERQTSGQCGWTETPALASCLAKSET